MNMKHLFAAAAVAACAALPAFASSVLIINYSSTTSENGTTADITNNLKTLHEAAGNTVTIVDQVPADFGDADEIWDLGFSNANAISAGTEAAYLSFLQGGGGMFVMGENSSFQTRNNSIFSLIAAAGGGNLGFASVNSTQNVNSPFDIPNAVNSITYSAPGGIDGSGSGDFITEVAGGGTGTGVAWGKGDLANAGLGALTTIFDVNFMQNNGDLASQNLTKNLIKFIDVEINPVPVPASLPLLAAGFGIFGLIRSRRKAA